MREESHLEEMRTAIRGDFERLKERRGEQELMRVDEDAAPAPDTDEIVAERPEPSPGADVAPPEPVVGEIDPALPIPPEPTVDPHPGADAEPEPKRSWLQRFLSA